jgi:Family of unknown function (DUF5681)
MNSPQDDDDVGFGRPPTKTRWKKGQSGNRNRRYRKRSEGRIDMMTRLLLKPVEITVSGNTKKVPTLQAILLQLMMKEVEGDSRALSIRLKYEDFARRNSRQQLRTVFIDSDYTRALSAKPAKDDDHE